MAWDMRYLGIVDLLSYLTLPQNTPILKQVHNIQIQIATSIIMLFKGSSQQRLRKKISNTYHVHLNLPIRHLGMDHRRLKTISFQSSVPFGPDWWTKQHKYRNRKRNISSKTYHWIIFFFVEIKDLIEYCTQLHIVGKKKQTPIEQNKY